MTDDNKPIVEHQPVSRRRPQIRLRAAEVEDANADFREMERLALMHKARAKRAKAEAAELREALISLADACENIIPDAYHGHASDTDARVSHAATMVVKSRAVIDATRKGRE